MGKGISTLTTPRTLPSLPAPMPVAEGDESGLLDPPMSIEDRTKAERLNEQILQGKDPRRAALQIAGSRNGAASGLEKALMQNRSIVEQNREMFKKVGMKRTAPYKVLFEIMTEATKTVPFTEPDHMGVLRTRYEQVPDYTARLQAAKQVTILMGLDPRAEMKVNITNMGNGTQIAQVQIGEAYITIANMTDEAAQLAAYNEFQRSGKGFSVTRNDDVVEGQYTERPAPIGADGQ